MTMLSDVFRQRLSQLSLVTGLCAVSLGSASPASLAGPLLIAQSNSRSPESVTGALTPTSPVIEEGDSYYEIHTFEGRANEALIIDLISDEFDAYLILQSPMGEAIAEDDDGGENTNSQIVITLPTSGSYRLIARTFEAGQTGLYQLAWRAATAKEKAIALADQLSQQVLIALRQSGRYSEAIALGERALAIYEAQLGPNHPSTATSLNNLAALNFSLGRYDEAEPLHQRALAIREAQLDPNHPDTAQSLNNLAVLYRSLGRYDEAEPLYQRALAIHEIHFGSDHPSTAASLNNLALFYYSLGRYGESELLYQRALAITEAQLGSNHPSMAIGLNNLADLYRSMGRYDEAEPLYQRALAIYEVQLGPDHPGTAQILSNLALLYSSLGRYEAAEPLYQHALSIREAKLGPDHPDTAQGLNNLADLYYLLGRYVEAEPLYQRALSIHEGQLGPNHPLTALSLNNLAELYRSLGRYEDTEHLYRRALAINEAQLGSNHPSTTTSLNNLAALLYESLGRYGESEPLYQRALAIREAQLDPNHIDIAQSLNNLAELYRSQGRHEAAEPLYQRALGIHEGQLGPDHPLTATSLNNLALLYESLSRYEEAEPLYQRALAINEAQLGSNHIDTASSLNNLALLYWTQGQLENTFNYLQRGLAVEETVLSRNLVVGSDANKRDYLATVSGATDWTISLHLNELSTSNEAARLALTSLLQRKGRILDLFTNLRAQLADDPAALTLLDELNAASAQLATLYNTPPAALSQAEYQAQIQALLARVDDLEDQLSRRSTDFAAVTTSPTLTAIQTALPPQTALVEFVRYQPFDPTASAQERYGEDRYAAYILQPDGTIQGIDLGPATTINAAVSALSISLASANTPIGQVKSQAQTLETLVMAPVRQTLGGTTTLFLSPDSALNLIPFEALMDQSGSYLVETYQFRYLTSGRDLMRLDQVKTSRNPALLVGNPTYGRPGELVAQADTRAIDFENRLFPALLGTQSEVDLIASKLSGAQVYTQTNATEALIKQQAQPNILHIATHGFFEPVEETLNPLLQSGLILAGAAAGGQSGPDQDGILTALEVTGMNLSGTQLVVLSACETGLGELAAGEGIYGLRRAFVLAGSQTQVISLWKVSDTATQELMVDYYDRLLAGSGRDAALRDAQLAFIESEEYSHPYYWAAFVGAGDWRPLQR